jgi:ABC-type transport system substrate-binding protein
MAIQGQLTKVGVKLNMDIGDNPSTMAKVTSGNATMFVYTSARSPWPSLTALRGPG